MAWFKIENEDWEYRKRDLDPVLAQEKLAAMDGDDDFEDFDLTDELMSMQHAEFFKDIAKPEKPKVTIGPRQEKFPKKK